jgi:diguanylate cyclase (GGDEF)-like protein
MIDSLDLQGNTTEDEDFSYLKEGILEKLRSGTHLEAAELRLLANRIERIDELDAEVKHLREQVTIDDLTGLENAARLRSRASQLMERLQVDPSYSNFIAYADLDRFKTVNDVLGHGVGDEILRMTGRYFQMALKSGDGKFRKSGDEFVLLFYNVTPHPEEMPDASLPDVLAHQEHNLTRSIERIVEAYPSKIRPYLLRKAHEQSARLPQVSMTLGIARIDPDNTFESALEQADLALRLAKGMGRNQVIFYQEGMETEEPYRTALQTLEHGRNT